MKTFIVLVKSGEHTYAKEVWNERKGKRVIQHYVRSLGRATRDRNGNIQLLSRKLPKNFVIHDHADAQLLFKLAENLSIPDIINEKTAANKTELNPGMLLTLLAVAHASENLSFPKFRFWYSYSGLEGNAGIEAEKLEKANISRTLETISWKPSIGSEDTPGDIVYEVEKALWSELRKLGKKKRQTVYYDITPIYSYSEALELAFFGRSSAKRSSSGKKTRQINIGLAVSAPHAFPILHRIFAGNVTDKSTLREVCALLVKKKFFKSKPLLVLDRGFDPKTALKNLRDNKKTQISYLIALPFCSKEIREIAAMPTEEDISKPENLLAGKEEYAIKFQAKLFGAEEHFILTFDPARKAAEKLVRDRKLKKSREWLEACQKRLPKGRYMDEKRLILRIDRALHGVGRYVGYRLGKKGDRITGLDFWINTEAVKEAELLDGRFLLVCSDKRMGTDGCVKTYSNRDLIEKAFRTFKGPIGIEPTRCRRVEQVNTRIFISYLSYVLLSYLRYLMEKDGLLETIGVEELLMKANRIKIVKGVEEEGVTFSSISTLRAGDKKIIPFLKKFIDL